MINIEKVCIVKFGFCINWKNYNEDIITVSENKKLEKIESRSGIVQTFSGDVNLTEQVFHKCEEYYDEMFSDIKDYVRIKVSTPTVNKVFSENDEITFWKTVYISYEDLQNKKNVKFKGVCKSV